MAVDIDQYRTLEEVEARQAEVERRLQELNQQYGGQALPDKARAEWNELNEELGEKDDDDPQTLRGRVRELKAREARVKEFAERDGATEPWKAPETRIRPEPRDIYDLERYRRDARTPSEEIRMLRDGAMRAVESATYPHIERGKEEVQGRIERLFDRVRGADGEEGSGAAHLARLILATGSDLYKRAFGKAIAGRPTTNEESFALDRALSLTGSAGGFAVPFELDPTVLGTSNGAVNPMRQISRVENITVDEWRGVSSAGITTAYAAEATEASDNAPTLVQPTVSTEKAQAFIPYSIEIGMDWASLGAEVGRMLVESKDELEADKFINGSGTNEPFGVLTGTPNTINAATGADAFTLANLFALAGALPPRYRPRGRYIGDLAILNRVRQFETSGGSISGVWVEGLAAATPGTEGAAGLLLGKPAHEASAMPDAATTGNKFLLYGDFGRYLIVDRVGLTMENIQHLFGANQRPTGQRGIYAFWRNGAKVLDANAFRALVGTA